MPISPPPGSHSGTATAGPANVTALEKTELAKTVVMAKSTAESIPVQPVLDYRDPNQIQKPSGRESALLQIRSDIASDDGDPQQNSRAIAASVAAVINRDSPTTSQDAKIFRSSESPGMDTLLPVQKMTAEGLTALYEEMGDSFARGVSLQRNVWNFVRHKAAATNQSIATIAAWLSDAVFHTIVKKPSHLKNSSESLCFEILRGIILMEEKEVSLTQACRGVPAYCDIPQKNYWRLITDSNHITIDDSGKVDGENASGCMGGLLGGLAYMLETQHEKLSSHLLEEFHDHSIDGVVDKRRASRYEIFTKPTPKKYTCFFNKGYRDGSVDYKIYKTTEAGQAEWKALGIALEFNAEKKFYIPKAIKNSPENDFSTSAGIYISPKLRTSQECAELAQKFIDDYHQDIQTASGDIGKIETVIAKLCISLARHHLFNEGNTYMIASLVMNKLRQQNGLPLTLLSDPHILEGYGCEEVAQNMRDGVPRFNQLKVPLG
ncbi:hypothetical protein [Glaciimonas immobilis]|uniref:Fido domain-containing protein n=1 Tax=Glaciimonas immobilis TaxID=728004 RepID=A0A840RSL1_9BURK|nr:hypothetical protein [Glaciimonas immobilis]KAF3997141.1 hypothetical protein HAV38_15890 [Glaciimonas immobilis]MBB5200008.1 hypothetical protein [Glaciimonas immobilis]